MTKLDTGNEYIGLCILCSWHSPDYPLRDFAQWRTTWHVYEDHRDIWVSMFGEREPQEPDPRHWRLFNDDRG